MLGLVNASQCVRYLLSDQYGKDAMTATGVGISLRDEKNQSMNFLSTSITGQFLSQKFPSGENGGWYKLPMQLQCDQCDNTFTQQKRLTAILQKLPGQEATPGRVLSTAYVIVKVQ